MTRAFLVVLDSVGIGGAPDAGAFFNDGTPDTGANTVGHIAEACAEGRGDRDGLRSGPLDIPNLARLGLSHARMAMPEDRLDGGVELELRPPVPHLDRRDLHRIRSEKIRLGMQGLEIAADGQRFGDDRPVVEFENGQPLERIARRDLRAPMFALCHIDRHHRHLDTLFGEKHADTPRIGRPAAIIEFHRPFSHAWLGRVICVRRCKGPDRRRLEAVFPASFGVGR